MIFCLELYYQRNKLHNFSCKKVFARKQSHLRNTLDLHIFFLTKEISICTSMLFKSRIQWWDRDCFLTSFTFYFSFYTPVFSNAFLNSETTFFAIIVCPHQFPLYPKQLQCSSLPQQKYCHCFLNMTESPGLQTSAKPTLAKPAQIHSSPTNPALFIEPIVKLLPKSFPFHMPLDSLSNYMQFF